MVLPAFFRKRSKSKDENRAKSLSCLMGRPSPRPTPLLVLTAVLVYMNRMISFNRNHRELFKLPFNEIERDCPHPGYETIGDSTKPKICLTTLTDAAKADTLQRLVRWRNFNNLLEITWPNKQSYCSKHGYHLFDESMSLDTSRPPSWSKIPAVRRLLTEEDCDWVFWMDADTVIMNSEKRIEDFLPKNPGIDLLVVNEEKGLSWNAGAWLIRNTPWSLEFLDHWWNMKDFVKPKGLTKSGDNDALKDYLSSMDKEYFREHIAVPPRCLFNSVAKWTKNEEFASLSPEALKQSKYGQYNMDMVYHKGDFVAHVAGT